MLGVRALAHDTYKIDPELGDLEWAKGTYPTPYGIIEVSSRKTDEGTEVSVSAPEGVKIVR